MAFDYSVDVCTSLAAKFDDIGLHRPMRVGHYDAGTELEYEVSAVDSTDAAKVRLSIEKFVGGGFAGQVYRVKILDIDSENATIGGLAVGGVYALKILIPPSGFSNLFRNVLYAVGFQGPFQLQVNPAAARSGAIWQKFIRRAAATRFADEEAVNDVHGLFVDETLGSCGEISDWVEGRTWRLEVDENLDTLKKWRRGKQVDPERLGSAEYRAKHEFMHKFVGLLHDIGAHEFARQYEWSTCKSQPNCLKRSSTEDEPDKGLTAVDFRAGLTLLPFLPMSPGDFALIGKGVARGSLVQFDLGNIDELEAFIAANPKDFEGTEDMLEDLKKCEKIYRSSIPDVTHNGLRLLGGKLWASIFSNSISGWKLRNQIDEAGETKLKNSKFATFFAYIIGIIPFFGRFFRKCAWNGVYRKHYGSMFNPVYFGKAVKGRLIEKAIGWHRDGRMTAEKTEKVSQCVFCMFFHSIFSILPVGLHRFVTDWAFFKSKLGFIFVRPFRLYFSKAMREQWMRDMLVEGKKKHIITDEDVATIESQLQEPYIQRYLFSLVVHVMTLPVTQIVSVIVAAVYVKMHPELTKAEATAAAVGILALFQVIPISPGSICRGLYTTGLAIYDRNFKDYNVALFLSYFKYIGYLAFPIQMAYRYPTLARFMSGHWATNAVHVVPVFGERGALFEHWVYCLFYNWPLTLRRKMASRKEFRAKLSPRYWHVGLAALGAAGIFAVADKVAFNSTGIFPGLKDIWYLAFLVPFAAGAVVTIGAGGAILWKRIAAACVCGAVIGVLYATITSFFAGGTEFFQQDGKTPARIITMMVVWRVFAFTIFATIGAIITELMLPDPVLD
ncbi:MAG: hypothetical protein FVQ82_13910 [Planctomycetes bacterium]|nr:hypothetical protein [Planctomycetota bacterium]